MNEAGNRSQKRSEDRQKGRVLNIRVSEAERHDVEALAERAGLTLAPMFVPAS